MVVYEFIHTIYDWLNNEYDVVGSEIFLTYKDAYTYFKCTMDNVLAEYLETTNVNTLEELDDIDYCYYAILNDDEIEPEKDNETYWPRFYISVDEYGSDTILIRKKNILSFKEE